MPLVIDVQLNTAFADLDEALRGLLRRELDRQGFEGVDIAFEAPSREWSAKLTNPTVDLFLYDVREATDRAEITPAEKRGNGQAIVTPPPLRLRLTYAVTAWTKAVEDEHRLLSQVVAILYSYRPLPEDIFAAAVDGGSALRATETLVGRAHEDKSDFWASVGGQYKASIDYCVHINIESGASLVRGPEVRMQTIHTRVSDGSARTRMELHRLGGTVRDAGGEPMANAWVALPELGVWTATDHEGRFRLDRISPGSHRVIARTANGLETEATVAVPGERADLLVDAPRARGSRSPARRGR
jgi:Pvc16 N-terminal domain/Carboxypeptidase regulatory-like domain